MYISNNSVVWVASYPKSGNTWIRFLLANLLHGPITKSEHIEQIIPDIHKPLADRKIYQFGETIFLKTHWKADFAISMAIKTFSAIYIVRNPLDIIASHINYLRLSGGAEKDFIDTFINFGGFPYWLKFHIGTWIENVESWVVRKHNFSSLILRYEDLKINPHYAVFKICNFFNLKKSKEEIGLAIGQSSFENLLILEEQELKNNIPGFFKSEHLDKNDLAYRFMNRGEPGTYRKFMTNEQIKRALDRFGPTMEILGYELKSYI